MEFDEKLKQFARAGYEIPTRDMIKNAEQIEKIKEKLSACLRCDDVMAKAEFCDKLCVALVSRTKRYSELVLG